MVIGCLLPSSVDAANTYIFTLHIFILVGEAQMLLVKVYVSLHAQYKDPETQVAK